jgi:CDGSH-type Zn-finger protein
MNHSDTKLSSPAEVFLETGKIYFWCSCGKTKKEPFCDGSHEGTGCQPLKYQVISSKTVFLYQCKKTQNPPICDGSHKFIND